MYYVTGIAVHHWPKSIGATNVNKFSVANIDCLSNFLISENPIEFSNAINSGAYKTNTRII